MTGMRLGITRVSSLTQLSSLHFPHSFPFDLMHCMLQNVVSELQRIWGGRYKSLKARTMVPDTDDDEEGLSPDSYDYHLSKTVWEKISKIPTASRRNMSYQMGAGSRSIYAHWRSFKATNGEHGSVGMRFLPWSESWIWRGLASIFSTPVSCAPST